MTVPDIDNYPSPPEALLSDEVIELVSRVMGPHNAERVRGQPSF